MHHIVVKKRTDNRREDGCGMRYPVKSLEHWMIRIYDNFFNWRKFKPWLSKEEIAKNVLQLTFFANEFLLRLRRLW